MPKRAVLTSRIAVLLDAQSPVPLYKQLYERVRRGILSGRLERGVRLPSTRLLASELGISRTTVVLAYEQLLLEGYLQSQVGQGTSVARNLPVPFMIDQSERLEDAAQSSVLRVASRVPALQEALSSVHFEGSPRGTYRGGEPAVEQFPYELWARLIARRARQSLREVAHYQSPAGYFPLRDAIATHISLTRGVRCTPDQVILTAGSQGAIDLATRTLLNPGEAAWLENPGYFGARGALLAAGAHLIPIPVDAQGLDVEYGKQRWPQARLAGQVFYIWPRLAKCSSRRCAWVPGGSLKLQDALLATLPYHSPPRTTTKVKPGRNLHAISHRTCRFHSGEE